MKQLFKKCVILCVALLLTGAAGVATAAPEEPEAAFDYANWVENGGNVSTQHFSYDYFIKGMLGTCGDSFHTGKWEIHAARLTLVYATSQLLDMQISEISVSLNGQPLHAGSIAGTNGEKATLLIDLPADVVNVDAANTLSIDLYVRQSNDDACEELIAGADWINIFKESYVDIAYTPTLVCDTVATLYEQLTAIDALENGTSAILLNGSDEGALTAAARAAAGLAGNAALHYTALPFVATEAVGDLARYQTVLYICAYDNIPQPLAALMDGDMRSAAKNGAAAALLRYGETDVLLVTGSDPTALANAGAMLQNAFYMSQLTVTGKAVTATEDFTMEKVALSQYQPLTASGVYVTGSYRQSADFYIAYPANRRIAASSELSLDIRYSENIDFTRSLVTVFLNDVPIGSRRLDKQHANGYTITLPFPEDLKITGGFTVKVAFDLDVGEDWCRLPKEEMPWGYVAPSSMLKLYSVDVQEYLFDYYPSPFVRDGAFNSVAVVLPEAPTAAELTCMHRVMMTLGRFLNTNGGSLRATTVCAPETLAGENVIAIGTAGRNPLLRDPAVGLHLAFSPDGTRLLSNDLVKLDARFGAEVGAGQLVENPYAADRRALMIVSGASDEALARAGFFLSDVDELWKLNGDAYIADAEDAYGYTFALPAQEETQSSVTSAQRIDVVSVALASGLLLGLCILAIVLMIRKHKGEGPTL